MVEVYMFVCVCVCVCVRVWILLFWGVVTDETNKLNQSTPQQVTCTWSQTTGRSSPAASTCLRTSSTPPWCVRESVKACCRHMDMRAQSDLTPLLVDQPSLPPPPHATQPNNQARYGLTNFETYKEAHKGCGHFHQWDPLKAAKTQGVPSSAAAAAKKKAAAAAKPAASRKLLF